MRRLLPGLVLLGLTLMAGTAGFSVLEGWCPLDALYATILVISTLGFASLQLRAGATRAITPASLGGCRMAGLLLRPTVIELLDVLVSSGGFEMWLEEVRLRQGSPVLDRSLGQARLREDVGVTVLAIKRRTGELITNPPAETVIQIGDTLVALGTRDSLSRLDALGA